MVTLLVSGIVAPVDPNSSFWTSDSTPAVPDLQGPPTAPYWVAGVIARLAESDAVQTDFGRAGITMQWRFPLALGSVTAQQAQPLSDALTSLSAPGRRRCRATSRPVSSTLAVSSGLLPTLATYFATAQSVDALLWLLWVSLTVTGVAVLLLTARMVAMRRSAEFAVVRARGASLLAAGAGRRPRGGGRLRSRGRDRRRARRSSPARGPGVRRQPAPAGDWWPPAAILAVAVCGPAVIAAWQHRLPRRRRVPAAGGRAQPRARSAW